jgi:hypothetical protein
MEPAKIRRYIRPLVGVLKSNRFFEQMHESYFQTLKQWHKWQIHEFILSGFFLWCSAVRSTSEYKYPDTVQYDQYQGYRQEYFPAKSHQLVITIAWVGCTNPHAEEYEEVDFGYEVDR